MQTTTAVFCSSSEHAAAAKQSEQCYSFQIVQLMPLIVISMVIKGVIRPNCQNCVSPVANQSGYVRSCYYSSVSLRVKFSSLQTALIGQRSKGWQGGTTEGSFFSPAVFLAHMSLLQRTRICLRKRGTGGVTPVRRSPLC